MNEYMNADTREKIIILRAIKRLDEQFNQANKDDYVHELGNICEAFLYFFAELSDENKRFCEEAMNEISNVDLNKIREISLDLRDEKEKNGLNTDDDYEKVTDWIEKWINSLYESTTMKTYNKYIKEFKENVQKLEETPIGYVADYDTTTGEVTRDYEYQYDVSPVLLNTIVKAATILNKIAESAPESHVTKHAGDFNLEARIVAGECVDLLNELLKSYEFETVISNRMNRNFEWNSDESGHKLHPSVTGLIKK